MTTIERIVQAYRGWGYRPAPQPSVDVTAGATVPAWTVHMLAIVLAGATVAAAGLRASTPWGFLLVIAVVPMAWMAWRPGHEPGVMALGLAAILLLWTHGPFDVGVFWIAPLAWLTIRSGALASLTPWRGHVQLRGLVLALRRDAVIIAGTESLAAVTALLSGAAGSVPIAVAGAAALIGIALLVRAQTRKTG